LAVAGTLHLLAVNRNLRAVHIQHDPLRGIESFRLGDQLPCCASTFRLGAALTSRLQSFETELLTQEENRAGLAAVLGDEFAEAETFVQLAHQDEAPIRRDTRFSSRSTLRMVDFLSHRLGVDLQSVFITLEPA
jgi:hypothetical protein